MNKILKNVAEIKTIYFKININIRVLIRCLVIKALHEKFIDLNEFELVRESFKKFLKICVVFIFNALISFLHKKKYIYIYAHL